MMRPMQTVEFPKRQVAALQDVAARLIEARKPGSELRSFARQVLIGFYDVCMQAGLDRVLVELQTKFAPLDLEDRSGLADHEVASPALVTQIELIDLDGGGPRGMKPRQVAESIVAGLGLTVVEEADRTISLGDDVRSAVFAALASVVNVELAAPKIRDTVIDEARPRCEERFIGSFNKITAQLDERGMQLLKQPKVPIDASQAVQQILFQARNAVIDRIGRLAIDRAKPVLARASAEAAARIDKPISLRLTPRDVAIIRACDSRVPKLPPPITRALLDGLSEGAAIVWRAAERIVRPYAASQTFAVGELVEHPKFGQGTVVSTLAQRIDVEFADAKRTLIHVPHPRAQS
jgi:hypothetical protein